MPELERYDTAEQLAAAVAERFAATVAAAIEQRGRAAIALTAGSIMEKVWTQLAETAGSLDWSSIDVFWGDERFVASDSSDRNDLTAEKILFSSAPFSAATRYSMPPAGGQVGDDLDAAAAAYATTLRDSRRPSDEGEVPSFDLALIGVGPDGHCCSLFPDHPSSRDLSAPVIPVRNSPKPPPLRMSLSFDALNTTEDIWVIASGDGKADAVAAALAPDADREHVPSAGAVGRRSTVWWVDAAAAAKLD